MVAADNATFSTPSMLLVTFFLVVYLATISLLLYICVRIDYDLYSSKSCIVSPRISLSFDASRYANSNFQALFLLKISLQ